MENAIVSSSSPVTCIGGSDASPTELHAALKFAPIVVAADGGAELAMQAGVELSAVIGDFDSIPKSVLLQVPESKRHHVAEQMSTDFEKVLMRVDAPVLVGIGFLGGRLDHELAAFHALLAFADKPCILMNAAQIVFLAPPKIALPAHAGEVVSLFPLCKVEGRSSGLTWPIDGLAFAPGHQIGTSNSATGPIEIEIDRPGMLMILPARFVTSVIAALVMPDRARWPARAR